MEDSSDRGHQTASEEEEHHNSANSADSDESGSEDGSMNAGALLDLEAFESGEEGEEEDDDEDDDDDYGGMSIGRRDNYHSSFPQFCRLPIELRQRVWEFFDPDLRAPARVFDVQLVSGLWPSGTLDQQTAPARTLLEVHRESRQMGLKFYPDTLPMQKTLGYLRYNKDRDIIFLGWMSESMDWNSAHWESIAGDLKDVKNLAFEVKPDIHLLEVFGDLPFHIFPSLQKVYPCWDACELHTRNLKWCVSDSVHVFHVQTEELQPGLGEDIEFLYCWPNLEKHLEYAEKEIPTDLRLGRNANKADKPSIELWPVVLFSHEGGVQRYHRLREKALADPDAAWDSESSSESDDGSSEENEYESDGIDDAPIDESDGFDEGDDDLVVQGSSDDEVEGGSGFAGFSPQGDTMAFSGDVEPVGHFSSLEPESPKHGISDDSDSDEEPARPVKRPRRQVVSSDSENDSADEPVEKAIKQSRPPNRRAGRVVLSDSDNSDEDGDDGAQTKRKDSRSEESDATAAGDDSAEESDEEADEDVKKPMSLAERLRLYRSENPVPEDGAGSASDGGDSETFYQDPQDDDDLVEGGAYGDDDDEVSDNDLVMDMAEEGSYGGGGGGGDDDDDGDGEW
ncbi:hypothetical protein MGN70_009308 [Eutypa lata]|nr:hypothetical protein MGN70_009308 [Eutypa lata]